MNSQAKAAAGVAGGAATRGRYITAAVDSAGFLAPAEIGEEGLFAGGGLAPFSPECFARPT